MTSANGIREKIESRLEHGQWLLTTLLGICIVRLWVVPLPSSFWLDECVTAFVVDHPRDASFAIAPQVPQSIYYLLPRVAQAISGPSEASLRMPSTFVMAIGLWLIARLAARLIHPRAGWFAVFACLAFSGINYDAIDARPYGLGMMMAAASLFLLVRWLDEARWRDAALFALLAALVWRVHLLYWPFYLVIVMYSAARLAAGSTPVQWPQWSSCGAALAILLVPTTMNALALAREAHSHVIAALPTLHVFEHALRWNIPLFCGGLAWLAAKWRRWPMPERRIVWTSAVLIAGWWLAQPIALYVYSITTGNSVFVGRYLSLMLPGAALAATAAAAYWVPTSKWHLAAGGMALAALAFQGHWDTLVYRHDISDWRSAAAEVNRFARTSSNTSPGEAAIPIVVPSPFIEARSPAWSPSYTLPGFLYAQIDRYPVSGKPYLLPFEGNDAEGYADELAQGELADAKQFAIYGSAAGVRYWRLWFSRRSEFSRWTNKLLKFGDVHVAEFRRN
jgi:hypothetical protein